MKIEEYEFKSVHTRFNCFHTDTHSSQREIWQLKMNKDPDEIHSMNSTYVSVC